MAWRDALAGLSCWVPARVRASGGGAIFATVAGRRPATTDPSSWCSASTAELLVERFTGRDQRRGAALVIGATFSGEIVGVNGAVRLARIAIADGWSNDQGVAIYTEAAVVVGETLGTAVERHLDSDAVSLLLAYPVGDTDAMRALATIPEVRLILSEFWFDRTAPVSDRELCEVKVIDAVTLAAVIGEPAQAAADRNTAIGVPAQVATDTTDEDTTIASTPSVADRMASLKAKYGAEPAMMPEPPPAPAMMPEPSPASSGAKIDVERVAQAIYDANQRASASSEKRAPVTWETITPETRAWVTRQAEAAITSTLEQLQPGSR